MPRILALGLLVVALLLAVPPAWSQDHGTETQHPGESEHSEEQEFHRNHFGGVIGVSTHHDSKDSGITLGLEYARVFSHRWSIVAYIEQVSSDLERDVIVALGVAVYPMRRLGLILAPGLENVAREVEEHGEVKTEEELEIMLRVGVAYGFQVGSTPAAIAPTVMLDYSGDRWTSLVGLGMVVGF